MLPNFPHSTAIAGGIIVGGLLDVLIAKNVLTRKERCSVLADAQSALASVNDPEAGDAAALSLVGPRNSRIVSAVPVSMRNRPNWSRALPAPLLIPEVMTLKTLADVRTLMQHLPEDRRGWSS
jgi:hypothetical protein